MLVDLFVAVNICSQLGLFFQFRVCELFITSSGFCAIIDFFLWVCDWGTGSKHLLIAHKPWLDPLLLPNPSLEHSLIPIPAPAFQLILLRINSHFRMTWKCHKNQQIKAKLLCEEEGEENKAPWSLSAVTSLQFCHFTLSLPGFTSEPFPGSLCGEANENSLLWCLFSLAASAGGGFQLGEGHCGNLALAPE